jgi:hypothetical protein
MEQINESNTGKENADGGKSDLLSDVLCCDLCGGTMISIRGRHPGMDDRIVCPTCMAETLDDIRSRLRDDYGRAYKAT